jgi:uncharacterized protein YgbK (DUF1537 family)
VITAVLDDDPTGTQAMADVEVVLDWEDPRAWDAVRPDDRAVHLLTNSRAHDARAAAALVASAAVAARFRRPRCRTLLRGDSTLRAHMWEEYAALRSVVEPDREDVPLLLVPALPAAGRMTIGGVHLIEREGRRTPLDQTEYARDGSLAYSSANLAQWAQERSRGAMAAADAVEVGLARVRDGDGAVAVAEGLEQAGARGRPCAVVPDAETDSDLLIIAEGVRLAERRDTSFLIRCAPAFVAALTSGGAPGPAEVPTGIDGILVLCGSFVSLSTAQMRQLELAFPGSSVTARVAALAGEQWEEEVEEVAGLARALVQRLGVAAVVTERAREPALTDPAAQRRIAVALAQVAPRVGAGLVIAKGGITSAVTAREGLGAHAARVLGPLRPGVALWQLMNGSLYVVVPGNVGSPELLAELVQSISSSRRGAVMS